MDLVIREISNFVICEPPYQEFDERPHLSPKLCAGHFVTPSLPLCLWPVSKILMWPMILGICMLALTAGLGAQTQPVDKEDRDRIQHAKSLLVSLFDGALPKVSLEYFLKYESGGAAIHWEATDCGEQGDPEIDARQEVPMCVEADFDSNHRSVSVLIAVGTSRNPVSGKPVLFRATITDLGGDTKSIRRFGDLPMELHRPLPRLPRDLPAPRG
jgi:hypothetical protein